MKTFLIIYFAFFCCLSKAQTKTLAPGEIAPNIKLVNVDDRVVSFENYPSAKGFIVIFTCNTCPYSRAYEQRIIELNSKYASLEFPVITINPNDPESSPGDAFEAMKEKARSNKYIFPYLYDKGQEITKLYGPKATPTAFVIKKTEQGNVIEYEGAIDNDTQNTNPDKVKYVEDALSALINGKQPAVTVTKAIGCRIKLKE